MRLRNGILVLLPPMALALACGGGHSGGNGGGGCPAAAGCEDGGLGAEGSAEAGHAMVLPDGAVCIDVDPTAFGTSCSTDADCTLVATGQLCSGQCTCGGGTPINTAAVASYEASLSSLKLEQACPCHSIYVPRCVSGTCTACDGSSPPGCP